MPKMKPIKIGVSRARFTGVQRGTKKSEQLQQAEDELIVVVAFYKPAGNSNRSGQFALNVSKPIPEMINGIE